MKDGQSSAIFGFQSLCINFGILFLYCFAGGIATGSYQKIESRLCNSNWYEYPIDAQKYILMMLQNSQLPIYYDGFGVAILSLETFGNVNSNELFVKFSKQLLPRK